MFIDFSLPYHSYCETALGALAEPVNMLSCLTYWAMAVWVWTRRDDDSMEFHPLAAILLFTLGTSGMVWHATGIRLAFAFDVIAIYMLMTIMVTLLCHVFLRLPLWGTLATVAGLVFFSAILRDSAVPWMPQQGGAFLPALLFLAVVALKIQPAHEKATIYLLAGAYILFFGLIFRSIDLYACWAFPLGTHFLWHICSAFFVLYIVKALAAIKKPREYHRISDTAA